MYIERCPFIQIICAVCESRGEADECCWIYFDFQKPQTRLQRLLFDFFGFSPLKVGGVTMSLTEGVEGIPEYTALIVMVLLEEVRLGISSELSLISGPGSPR